MPSFQQISRKTLNTAPPIAVPPAGKDLDVLKDTLMSSQDYILMVLTQKAEDMQLFAPTDDYLAESVRRWQTCAILRVRPLFEL